MIGSLFDTQTDSSLCLHLLRVAAAGGEPDASAALSLCLAEGLWCVPDAEMSARELAAAVDGGSAPAMCAAAAKALGGGEVADAERLWQRAAALGDPLAEHNLGALELRAAISSRHRRLSDTADSDAELQASSWPMLEVRHGVTDSCVELQK